jgi:hypothetical protein
MFLHHEAEGIDEWLGGWGFETIIMAPLAMVVLALVAFGYDPDAVSATFAAFVATSPVWLPLTLFIMFWRRWMHYIRFAFWFTQPMVLLHIELPAEVEKSPLAVELVLTALYNSGGEATFLARIWEGKFRATTTLEIVSNGGRIGYYVHIRRAWKDVFEARLYGQFPEAQISEVEDYFTAIGYKPSTHELWGTEYKKGSPDAVPIRSYVDWGLDKDPDKPEKQVDPLTHVLEFFSTAGPDEHLSLQIIMKARKKDEWYGFYKKADSYVDGGKKAIKKIFDEAVSRAQARVKNDEQKEAAAGRGVQLLSQPEKDRIEAIERNFSKLIFECGFRTVYIAKHGAFDGTKIGNIINLFTPFRYPNFNSISVTRGMSIFDFPWQDWGGIRRRMIQRRLYFWFRHRAYFYVPLDQVPVMMTTEELATLWHFPSSVVKTPGLVRVASRVGEAPPNLPTATVTLPGQ